MDMTLDYGRDGLTVSLPDANVVAVLKSVVAPPIAEPGNAIAAALTAPIGTTPLLELARNRRDVCIVVCDGTRPVPNAILLPPVLRTLAEAGIAMSRITILIATGTHRPNTPEELEGILGTEIARNFRIVNHDCTDKAMHRSFGTTESGVPVYLDKTYTDADLKITIGMIEPHFMAGYSGGRKMVMPGIAALETVQAWHSPRFLEHPNATNGIIQENPVHDENTRIARLCPPDFILDVTLDRAKHITGVFAGAMEAAWQEGVMFAERHFRALLPHPADIVITSGGGAPLDATFYQTVKGMVGALPIVKQGGDIIIASECAEGVGGAHFTRTLRESNDLQEFVAAIQSPDWSFVPDQWQVEEFAKVLRHATVHLICDGIPPEIQREIFVSPAKSITDALEIAFQKHGADATIAVIPQGPYTIPAIGNS